MVYFAPLSDRHSMGCMDSDSRSERYVKAYLSTKSSISASDAWISEQNADCLWTVSNQTSKAKRTEASERFYLPQVKPKPQGFPKSARIVRRSEYRAIQRSPLRVVTDHFIIYARKRRRKTNRVGITASKKVGNAVVRNRVKRLVRECFRLLQRDVPKELDLVLVARNGRGIPSFKETQRELISGANRLLELLARRQQRT